MAQLAQPLVAATDRTSHKLRRDVGLVGLVLASLSSIIGAGWLFAALFASSLAGPAAIISWLIGGAAMSLLALTHAELGAAYPVASGNARFPHFAFGRLVGFTGGWVAFVGAVTVGPIMVEATLLYASNYVSSLTTVSGSTHVLTAQGYVVAALLLLLFCTINVLGVRWLAKTTTVAACFKLLVPALVVVGLLATSAHGENFTSAGGFMPYGWKGVFVALTSGGIVFAYLGFEQAVQLGGESRRPGRNIPIAIIGGLVLFLPFPGWQQLVGFISGAAVIAYAMVPLSLGALRRQDPERTRPFRLPAASLLAPAAFVVASEILLFGGWSVVWKLIAAI